MQRHGISRKFALLAICLALGAGALLSSPRRQPAAPPELKVPPAVTRPLPAPAPSGNTASKVAPAVRPRVPVSTTGAESRGQPAASARLICVGLSPAPVASVPLEVDGPFVIRDLESQRPLARGKALGKTTVTHDGKGLRVGKQTFASEAIEIVASTSPGIWVDGHQYRGVVQIHARQHGQLQAVNVLPLEEYLASVVDSEMPIEFSAEARKAQAVVARTYAVYQMRHAESDALIDVYSSVRSQKYLGYQYRSGGTLLAGESADSRAVVAATHGLICTAGGKPFKTYYCAACGGTTITGSDVFPDASPALQSVPCNWCREAKLYRWSLDLSRKDVQRDLQSFLRTQGEKLGSLKKIARVAEIPPGRMPEYDVRDESHSVRIGGHQLRQALMSRGLYSPTFTVQDRGATLVFNGQGHGHGVGLCQWGARGMAHQGKSYGEILKYYYPGVTISRMASE